MTRENVLKLFISALMKYKEANGTYPSSTEYDNASIAGKPSRSTLTAHFGSWRKAVDEAIDQISLTDSPEVDSEEVIELRRKVEELSRLLHTPPLHLEGYDFRFGAIADTHLGSLYADLGLLDFAYDVFKSEGITTVLHAGDMLDGEKMYRGHDYEIAVHGADRQIAHCVDRYPVRDGITTYFIEGNHDRSFWKRGGTSIGGKISSLRPDLIFLGYQEADISIGDPNPDSKRKAIVRLFHGEDGTAYAISYKPQKYISELPGGTKPDILLMGHYHKAELLFYRGVVCVQVGCMQRQTPFMRGRRISAAVGFWIIDVTINFEGITKVKSEFFPVES